MKGREEKETERSNNRVREEDERERVPNSAASNDTSVREVREVVSVAFQPFYSMRVASYVVRVNCSFFSPSHTFSRSSVQDPSCV